MSIAVAIMMLAVAFADERWASGMPWGDAYRGTSKHVKDEGFSQVDLLVDGGSGGVGPANQANGEMNPGPDPKGPFQRR